MKKNKTILILSLLFFYVYFLIHLAIINDYGLSWDFHYHFYGGLYHLGIPFEKTYEDVPVALQLFPTYIQTAPDPFGPFTQIIPTLSYFLLHKQLHIFPLDSAYNFPMLIFGAGGVALLFYFVAKVKGIPAGILAGLSLALLPNYFGYLHTNMKDIPNAFAFSLAIVTFWNLEKKKTIRSLIFAVVSFAFAFNVKINSTVVPVICFVWFTTMHGKAIILSVLKKDKKKLRTIVPIFLYFILAPLAAIALWWPFWSDPLGKLLQLKTFYTYNTFNMWIFWMGQLHISGQDVPKLYPYAYIAVTTPLPILISFIIGFCVSVRNVFKKDPFSMLLILWFFIPLLRYLNPHSGAIDGVRHFMEFVYPLSALAGIGAWSSYMYVRKILTVKYAFWILGILSFFWMGYSLIHYHPYQTSYFNELIGGIKGGSKNFDVDFWGTPQKGAMVWLNAHAPENSSIYFPMAANSAGVYLRKDLLLQVNSKRMEESDYVSIFNRYTFIYDYGLDDFIKEKEKEGKLVYSKNIDGVPLIWVLRK